MFFSEGCPAEKWQAIVRKAVEQAEAGDAKARQWLSDILIEKQIKLRGKMLDLTSEQAQRRIGILFGLDVRIYSAGESPAR